jgi:hypothetical protein
VYEVPRKGPWSPRARKLNSHTITVLYRRRFFFSGTNLRKLAPGNSRRLQEVLKAFGRLEAQKTKKALYFLFLGQKTKKDVRKTKENNKKQKTLEKTTTNQENTRPGSRNYCFFGFTKVFMVSFFGSGRPGVLQEASRKAQDSKPVRREAVGRGCQMPNANEPKLLRRL